MPSFIEIKFPVGEIMDAYADLELSLHRADANAYHVDFRYSYSNSEADNQTDVHLGAKQQVLARFDLEKLNNHLISWDIKTYSEALTTALFSDESLRIAFAQARSIAERTNTPLRVRLSIGPSALELHSLRWETLHDPHTSLSLTTDHNIYFSRYLPSLNWRSVHLRAKGEMKALAAVAAPSGLEQYNLSPIKKGKEITTIATGLGKIGLKTIEHVTLNEIISALTKTEFDILYLVAHGTFSGNESYLWLEDEKGGIARVSGTELEMRLSELEHHPRLVVLTSCQSAGKGEGDVLSALGPRLAGAGIPAVMAMQDNLCMATAEKFMLTFFDEIQKDGRIDRALNIARGQVRKQPDWWVPVLFMRLKSGRLWYTPGFSEEGKNFEKFPAILQNIHEGLCTPIIGPGLIEPLFGSVREIARQWAEQFHYPMMSHEQESLPQVAQYLATKLSLRFPFKKMQEYLTGRVYNKIEEGVLQNTGKAPIKIEALINKLGTIQRASNPNDPHKLLAELPLPVFITTNADTLLESALLEAGKIPETMLCPWNEYIERAQTVFNHEPDYEPSPERPLVFHLFGRWDEPDSVVLTEDNYFNFLIGVTKNRKLIPKKVREMLSNSGLMFLGFQTEEWNFRVLYHSIFSQGSNRRDLYANIAVQIEPEDDRILEPARARRYLEQYFGGADINIFWGTPGEFLGELFKQLRKEQS
jgi:CHAT domain-containing protein